MRRAGLKSLFCWVVAISMAGAVAGCDNPFDPLQQTDVIQGLTYFDFSASQEHWDSDPEWDGLQVTMSYYNEFGDQLNFHDKPHKIQIEFWSEKAATTGTTGSTTVRDKFLASKTVTISNSDDIIRIPIEYYYGALPTPPVTSTTSKAATAYTEPVTGYLLVRLYPPQSSPQKELVFIQSGVEFYTPEDAPLILRADK